MTVRCLIGIFVLMSAGLARAQAPDLASLDIVERSVPDGPVAMVGNASIKKEDFLFLYRQQIGAIRLLQPSKEIPDSIRVMTGIRALAELVQRELLAQEAERMGVTVTPDDVTRAYQEEMSELRGAIKEQEKVEVSEEEVLRRGNQTKENALSELRKELLASRVRARIAEQKKVSVSGAEIEKFYNENPATFQRPGGFHLKQIFISPKPNPKEASEAAWAKAEEEMNKALARLKAGETFEGVAKAVSQAPDATNGGDLGLRSASELPAFFVEAAQKLQPGEVSAAFRSKMGLHAIKLISKEGEAKVSLEEARERIEALLMKNKVDVAIDEYTQPMMNDPERIKVFIDLEDNLANVPMPEGAQRPS